MSDMSLKYEWIRRVLGAGLDGAAGRDDEVVLRTRSQDGGIATAPAPRPVIFPEDPSVVARKRMEAEARKYVEDYIRIHGTLPKWELFMKDPKFRAAVEAADAKVIREAEAEIFERVTKENELLRKLQKEQQRRIAVLNDAISDIATRIEKAEADLGKYRTDPNGYLLILKLVTSLGAALRALAATAPNVDPDSRSTGELKTLIERCRKRLEALAGEAAKIKPKDMKAYIEERKQALGKDINKGYIPQEGQVGADVEMQLGGLVRGSINEIEFEPGQFSPYAGSDINTPHQMDVFGPTPDIVRKVVLIHARKIYPALKVVNDDALWAVLTNLWGQVSVKLPGLNKSIEIDPVKIFDSYLAQAKLFASLKHHFAKAGSKPTIVPFDTSGLGLLPALLDYVKKQILDLFPDLCHLILWYDVPPRKM